MKNRNLLLIEIAFILIAACKNEKSMKVNPFIAEYSTLLQGPPFDEIDTINFLPAFIEGLKHNDPEILTIIDNKADATFENTIFPFDKSGKTLRRVNKVLF